MDEKLKLADELYKRGYTCSQAVFCAFAEDMRLDAETAFRITEGFGGGFGGMQEVCGAFSAAAAVISYYMSSGNIQNKTKAQTYRAVLDAAELFKKEYGSVRCREILHGNAPKALQCGMKVKDAVLVVESILAQKKTAQNTVSE